MPIYEYKCKECGKINEFLIGVVRQEAEIKCHSCGSKELDKIFSKSFSKTSANMPVPQEGRTCCGREERCDIPPCSDNGVCRR